MQPKVYNEIYVEWLEKQLTISGVVSSAENKDAIISEMKKIKIEIDVKEGFSDDLKVDEYFTYKGCVYRFDGYEHGTYPYATNLETNEQIQLPHY